MRTNTVYFLFLFVCPCNSLIWYESRFQNIIWSEQENYKLCASNSPPVSNFALFDLTSLMNTVRLINRYSRVVYVYLSKFIYILRLQRIYGNDWISSNKFKKYQFHTFACRPMAVLGDNVKIGFAVLYTSSGAYKNVRVRMKMTRFTIKIDFAVAPEGIGTWLSPWFNQIAWWHMS